MSGAAADPTPGDNGDSAGDGCAPRLPIEPHLVQAVRSLEALKGQADVLLLMLGQIPGETAQIAAAMNTLAAHGNAAIAAIDRFNEIRSCKGQA